MMDDIEEMERFMEQMGMNEPPVDPTVCPNCDHRQIMELNGISMLCSYCGYERMADYIELPQTNYPIQDGMRTYNHVSLYSETQRSKTHRDVMTIQKNCKVSGIPDKVWAETANMFCEIQKSGQILRNSIRKGVIAALFYRICTANLVTLKPAVVAKIHNILPKSISAGQKRLDKMISDGIICNPLPVDYRTYNMRATLQRVCDPFPDGDKYIKFCEDLIKFTNSYHIATSSITTSKCAGALFILITNKATPMQISDIEAGCSCVKTTAKRYADAVKAFLALPTDIGVNVDLAQERLIKLFAKHDVPLTKRPHVKTPRKKKDTSNIGKRAPNKKIVRVAANNPRIIKGRVTEKDRAAESAKILFETMNRAGINPKSEFMNKISAVFNAVDCA